ncbi:MAG: Gfo/Idh/MocA family oxidoreductase [Candidatus Lokiarchaeota archaeon]|nr:Gfo/Idh/MocA family oxidoreductase [Candidatus Lokiarchaeota archaeon]
MTYVKFGIIGSGSVWRFHKFGWNNDPKIRFTAVYDVNEKVARRTAKVNNMSFFKDPEDFFKSDIDAVLIMVPHYLHEKYVIAAAKAGKHVLCEKPMATTLEGCDQMIEATKKAGVKFMIAENHRFLPAHEYIANAIQSGLIGNPFLVRSYEGVNEIAGLMKEGFWKGNPILAGGGALMDMGAHKFAAINWILNDKAESAYCWLTKQCTTLKEKAEDNAMVFLNYKKGTIVEALVSFSVISPPTNSLEIYGTRGTIIENHEWNNPVKIFSNHEDMGENKGKWYEPRIEHGPFPKYYKISMRKEDLYFADCILNDIDPEFTPEQAKEAIATVLLSYLSAKKEKTTTMEDLNKLYKNKGTKIILEELPQSIKENICLE